MAEVTYDVKFPHLYKPWDHQYKVWSYFQQDVPGLRGVTVWHRRAGKDLTALNILGYKALQRRGLYWHVFPTYAQGKKIAWDGMTSDGERFMDYFPPELIKSVNNVEMKVELANGSIYQIVGTDDVDKLVGTNPVGIIMSEWSLMNPKAWEYLEPILEANGGWALFVYTPRGRNHGFELYESARRDDDWFCQLLTVNDTRKPDGNPIVSIAQIDKLRKSGRPEEIIQQEYFCSFDASLVGAYYAKPLAEASDQGRIGKVVYDKFAPVYTCWDLGMDDENTIWWFQEIGNEIHWLKYFSDSGEGLDYYAGILKEQPYYGNYGTHFMPHDVNVRELGTGKTRLETLQQLGIIDIQIIPKMSPTERINAGRQVLPVSYFDEEACYDGLRALKEYTKEFDENKGIYKNKPLHNWASHGADAFGTGCVGYRNKALLARTKQNQRSQAITEYDIMEYE